MEAELETIAEAGHGFTCANEERAFARTLDFLNRKLKPALVETRTIVGTDQGPGAATIGLAWPNNRATEVAALAGEGVLYLEDPKGG